MNKLVVAMSCLSLFASSITASGILAGARSSWLSLMQVAEKKGKQDSSDRFDEEAALKEAASKKIPKSDLKGWLEYKRTEFMQRQDGTWERVVPPRRVPPRAELSCRNGDLEYGDFNYWQAYTGTNDSNGLSFNQSSVVPSRHTITSGGFDPVVGGTIMPCVNRGNHSAQLGGALAGSKAEGLRYTFTVTNQNKRFIFSYAVVLQEANDDSHGPDDQPFFKYEVKNAANWTIASLKKTANSGDAYFQSRYVDSDVTLVYRNWDCEAIDLSAYLGQSLSITFITADCTKTGHYGYAYIDDLCAIDDIEASFTLPDEVCLNEPIIADGTASYSELDNFWSIEESDAHGGRNPETEVMQWFLVQQAGTLDLKAFYQSKGKQFVCNKYYRIKLAVRNSCVPWEETVKLLYVKCPPVADAGPNRFICCTDIQSVQIGTPPVPGYTYTWTSDPPGFTSTSAMLTVPAICIKYILTVSDQHGCSSTSMVVVDIDRPFNIALTQHPATVHPCDSSAVLYPEIMDLTSLCPAGINCQSFGRSPRTTYLWDTGATTSTISVNPPAPTTYSVTVSNACVSRTAQITLQPCPALTGQFPRDDLLFPNAFTPNGDDINDVFNIIHYGVNAPPLGLGPAYNAINWKFMVWDRWGTRIVNINGGEDRSRCQGIPNGSIPRWNGHADGSSEVLPQGEYTWKLYLKNCSIRDYQLVKTGSLTLIR